MALPPDRAHSPLEVIPYAPLAGAVLAFVPVPVDDVSALHVDERRLADSMEPFRRATFMAGRVAMRHALRSVAVDRAPEALLQTSRGAPAMPPGLLGSVSHKRTRALAIAMPGAGSHVGVDLEQVASADDARRPSIAPRILTGKEQDVLHGLDPLEHRNATLLRFSLKEAIYKAIDPIVQRYVRFTEVELDVHADGNADVRLLLPELSGRRLSIEAHWSVDPSWIISTAYARW